jgi:hypothetical protein
MAAVENLEVDAVWRYGLIPAPPHRNPCGLPERAPGEAYHTVDAFTVKANGPFTFAAPVTHGGDYSVTVSQPTGQTCSASNGTGSSVTANINNVTVNCSTSTYTIGGNLPGLNNGAQITLDDNGAD